MKIRTLARRGAATAALSALAAGGLVGLPAPAHASVNDGLVRVEAQFHDDNSCIVDGGTPSPPDTTWTDDGVAVSQSTASSGTVTGVTPEDVAHLSVKASASIAAARIGSGPATIDAMMKISADAGVPAPATTCAGHAFASSRLQGTFTLAQPRWATITMTNQGSGREVDLEVYLSNPDNTVELQVNGRGHGSVTALLPAGPVELGIEGDLDTYTNDPATRRASLDGRIKIEIQPLGFASAATGKGQSYAQLGARSCPAGTVGVGITKKAARQAKSVQVTVNGRKAVTLKGKKLKKRALVLPAAASSRADVAARITLKNGKVVDVRRSYLACS
ncbi:hypothetical protein [Pimelobacter simplex]|uniref:hypothetical protein n=1 Tax=Nocardioides simplex TaxID=2045 RepID=UPI003AAFCD9E